MQPVAAEVTTEVAVVEVEKRLEPVVRGSGLEITKAQAYGLLFSPFMQQIDELSSKIHSINKDNPTKVDSDLARTCRLAMVRVRKAAEAMKEETKRSFIVEGKLIQNLFNVISSTSEMTEGEFLKIEKFAEIQEAKRLADLKIVREAEMQPFVEFIPIGTDLAAMDTEAYVKFHAQCNTLLTAKIEAQKKAEADRIAKAKADEEEREKIRVENEKLKAEAAEKEKTRVARNAELRPYIVFIRDYNKMLGMEESEYQKEFSDIKTGAEQQWEFDRKERTRIANEAAEKEKALAAERKKAADDKVKQEAIRKAEQERSDALMEQQRKAAAKAKTDADAKLKAEKEKSDKLAAEIKAKAEAEARSKREAEDKAAAELKAKQEAERKAKAAPDKEKLLAFVNSIPFGVPIQLVSDEAIAIHEYADQALNELIESLKNKIASL